jgi:RNA polymerase sigma-70 factor (ECF subfamily)
VVSADPRTDAELLAATGSDVEAFGVFYRRHSGWVLGFAARRVGNPEIAADITSEVFAAAFLAADRYDPSLGAPNSWLFGIASRQVGRALRRGAVETRARRRLQMERVPLHEDDVALISGLATGDEAVSDLVLTDEVLERVPAEALTLVRDRFIRERSYEDLAVEHGVSPAVIRKRVSRALAALRSELQGEKR